MAKQLKKKIDQTTEEKIKIAARKLFTRKGFAAVKTRDIAEEAGINLALLNYYFRSKEKLFKLIMEESFLQFVKGIAEQFNDENTNIDEKIEKLVESYIDLFSQYPDLPLFILSELREHPDAFSSRLDAVTGISRSVFVKQIQVMKNRCIPKCTLSFSCEYDESDCISFHWITDAHENHRYLCETISGNDSGKKNNDSDLDQSNAKIQCIQINKVIVNIF
jgi:AcrR family transcriptional regulator